MIIQELLEHASLGTLIVVALVFLACLAWRHPVQRTGSVAEHSDKKDA